jgi:hypothetical protein
MTMEELKQTIALQCVFCRSTQFALPYEGYRPHHGSFLVCANCGCENDFTSLMFVVKAKAHDLAAEYAEHIMQDMKKKLQDAFRGHKYIKIR